MTSKQFKQAMTNYKKGTYVAMVWLSTNGTYKKISKGVVRVLNTEIQTNKENIEYVRFKTTKNPYQKVHVQYFKNGIEISKTEYEENNKAYAIKDWFAKHLEDIIAIG